MARALDANASVTQAQAPRQVDDEVAQVFVALSRAKQLALFLFCQARGQREKVADQFLLLTRAGVQETAI